MTRYTALCIPLFLGTVALAADGPIIAVVGLHQPGVHLELQQSVSEQLAEAIEGTGKAEALAGPAVGPAIAGRQQIILEEALLSAGRSMLSSGRNLYDQAQPAEAVPVLVEAIERLEEGVAVSGDFRDLWEAHLILGTCHIALDDPFAADRSFRLAIALNPARSPDPAQYPPDVTARFEAVSQESAEQLAPLTIDATSTLDLQIDGRPLGSVPATVHDLRPGVHHVRGRSPGRHALARVELTGEAVEITLMPSAPSLGAAAESDAGRIRQTTDLYRGFGRHTQGVDFVLLAGTDSTVLHLQLYDVAASTFSKPTTVPFADQAGDEASEMVPLLLNLLDDRGMLPHESTQSSAVPLDRGENPQLAALLTEPLAPLPPPRRRRRTGLWIGLGAGALALAGGGVGVALANQGPRYDGTITVGPL